MSQLQKSILSESSVEEPVLSDGETLSEVLDVLEEQIPLEMQGDYQPRTLYQVLLHAASQTSSVEQSCNTLEGAPIGNTARHHLDKFDDIDEVEEYANNALTARISGRLSGTN